MPDVLELGLERYLQFYAQLQRDNLDLLPQLVAEDVFFCDPFNEVRGVASMRAIFEDMFERCQDPRFVINYSLREGQRALVRWEFYFLPTGSREMEPWRVDGVSELELAEDGKVRRHVDFWDPASGLYQRLPVIGWVIRRIRRKISVTS